VAAYEGRLAPYVCVTFDGLFEPSFSSLRVTDDAGKQVNVEKAKGDPSRPTVMTVALPTLAAGHYVVHWVAVASDGPPYARRLSL
jgi:methionine-rich copper-binding protein CopC